MRVTVVMVLDPALRKLRLVPFVALAACSLEPAKPPLVEAVRPGTYALWLCRVVCDASHPNNIIKAGFIVLDAVPIRFEPFPDSTRRLLRQMTMLAIDTGAANGCYVLERRHSIPTMAGVWGGGLVHWQRAASSDSITFSLDGTDDAGHEDTVAFTPGGFAGSGGSWGFGIDYPVDLVAGQYLGPPDQDRCAEAAAAYTATVKKIELEFRRHPEWRLPPPPNS